ncbi:MAG: RNA pseudouridine synthase [Puniceicoccales bacterium]|jgi:23S rRNA-/tRNA-specific pseudouridylate synthase|nr:RNA pseudouridine synthase [Puniceicoccales bacterium]
MISLREGCAALQVALHRRAAIVNFDCNGLFAVEKPAGVMAHPNGIGDIGVSLLSAPYDPDQQAFLVKMDGAICPIYLLNRIDSPTQGLVLLSPRLDTAVAVRDCFKKFQVKKTYYAIVRRGPWRHGQWSDWAREVGHGTFVRMVPGTAVHMRTNVSRGQEFQMDGMRCLQLFLHPETGRTHQLRFQCARRGFPIAGDRTYGDFKFNVQFRQATGSKNCQLLAAKIAVNYEVDEKNFTFCASSPSIEPFLSALKNFQALPQ